MAVGQGYSKTATNGLVFAFDTGDTRNSFLGRPTTNLMEGYGLSNYNNVPGSVTTNLTQTSDSYRGAPIWIQTLTPLDGSGVSWLSNGNNPGLGVVSSGGGGLANRYTGHSIFFKPTVPMNSSPIFTYYSNIGGWQSCCDYEDMGDGWFRAKVLWYDTTTRSDGKYWAINPLSATLNTPITIYWAGPFKEDLNSQYISQYTPTSRSNTESLLDLAGGNSMSVADVSFNSNLQITFDGTNDKIHGIETIHSYLSSSAIEFLVTPAVINKRMTVGGYRHNDGYSQPTIGMVYIQDDNTFNASVIAAAQVYRGVTSTTTVTANKTYHVVFNKNTTTGVMQMFVNGVLEATQTFDVATYAQWPTAGSYVGSNILDLGKSYNTSVGQGWGNDFLVGTIPVFKLYSKILTASEVLTNYNALKTRFGI